MKKLLIYLILLFTFSLTYAQLPHTFTQTAHIDDSRIDYAIAISNDGTIFVAKCDSGLSAYTYTGSSFVCKAHINESIYGANARDVAIGPDGTVFLANSCDGLRAYNYDGSSFECTAHLNLGIGSSVGVSPNGTVFLGDYHASLQVYSYDNTSFTYITGGPNQHRDIKHIEVVSDSLIFVTTLMNNLRAYTFDGSSLVCSANITVEPHSNCITATSDSLVFLANGNDGLRAYTFDGSSFVCTAHIDNGDDVKSVAVSSNGTVFLGNDDGGLRAYTYDDTSFECTAHINNGDDGYAYDVAIDLEGSIFLANGFDGLYAYTYSGFTGINDDMPFIPDNHSLSQNYPNPFNPSTTICYSLKKTALVSLKIYDLLGREIETLVKEYQNKNSYSVNFDASGLASGIYYYQLRIGNEFTETKKMMLIR